jgi:CPA1 family monovalent cation:H+ antiporter
MEFETGLALAMVMATGVACQWLAWRLKIPAILPLLAAGLLLGPLLGWLHPQEQLGALFFPLVSVAVAIILFEGALTLTWRELRQVVQPVRNLLTIGALVTWFGGAWLSHAIMGFSWELSLLFGALIIVTGPTVIAPLLRNVRPTEKIASVLRWEGILIDPIGATIAVLVFGFIVAGAEATLAESALHMASIVVVGTGLGLAAAYALFWLVHHYLIPDYLREIATLTLVVGVFSVANWLAHESGLLCVTVMGVALANTDLRKLREIWYFQEKLSILLISLLFVMLAASVSRADLAMLDSRSLLVLAGVILLLRPIGVQLSTLGSDLTHRERWFLSWIAPRGIVAAAVSSLFAFQLEELNIADAGILGPLTFLIIVGTVLIQGGTAKWVARRLGVAEAEPQGFLLMGADLFARELGLALGKEGFVVRLVDSNPTRVREARLRGLEAHQGNLLSDYTELTLDLGGIGRLLALTSNDEANTLACQHLEDEFGSAEVYQLPPKHLEKRGAGQDLTRTGRLLYAKEATHQRLHQLLLAGAGVRRTRLTEQFDWGAYQREYASKEFIPLLAVQGRRVHIWTVERPVQPQTGWTVVSLVAESGERQDSAAALESA